MSQPLLRPRRAILVACLSLASLLAGCRDAPTMPRALQQLAGGEEWVAIRAPHDLPSLETWLPYVDPATPAGRAALARIRTLADDAGRARAAGRLAEAAALDREAQRVAVLSLARNPEPRVVLQGLFALDLWSDRVRGEVALERAPGLYAALDEVRAARAQAEQRLAAGDTTSALLRLTAASERIGEFTPAAVALRVVGRVENRLRTLPESDAGVRRALHLLHYARQELAGGDPYRALRRALYALQLADGHGMRADDTAECRDAGC